MSEAYKNINQGRFTLQDAETINEAKLLEQTPSLSWESSDANRATRQAALAVGENASIAAFLVARARIVMKMIVAKILRLNLLHSDLLLLHGLILL